MVQPKLLDSRKAASQRFQTNAFFIPGLVGLFVVGKTRRLRRWSATGGNAALTLDGALSAQWSAGFDRFLMREIEQSTTNRAKVWQRDSRSQRPTPIGRTEPESVASTNRSGGRSSTSRQIWIRSKHRIARAASPKGHPTPWMRCAGRCFRAVHGEGLLVQTEGQNRGSNRGFADANQTPEMITGLRRD